MFGERAASSEVGGQAGSSAEGLVLCWLLVYIVPSRYTPGTGIRAALCMIGWDSTQRVADSSCIIKLVC